MPQPTSAGVVPWPPDVATAYRGAGFWEGRSIFEAFRESALAHLDDPAVLDGSTSISYAELLDRAEAGARRLTELGWRPDDRILLQLPNCWQFIVLLLACFRVGIVPVLAMPAHREHELSYLADHSESRAIVVPRAHRDFDHETMARGIAAKSARAMQLVVLGDASGDSISLDALLAPSDSGGLLAELPEATGDSVACFLLSGGTTGLPKLIARTHDDYLYNIRCAAEASRLSSSTVYLIALPAGHNFPLACPGLLGTLLAGGRLVSIPSPDPRRAFAEIEDRGVTHTALVPAIVQRWIETAELGSGADLSSLEVIQVGGSRLADELAVKVEPVLSGRLQQVFGMAEGLLNMTRLDDPAEVIVSTQGRPVSAADELRIVDEDGNELAVGGTGVLLTRGPYTPRGYYRAAEHNAKSFTPDGWYISGDIVQLRPDGNLVVQGRDKDLINRGGEKISAEEIENFVYGFPQVSLTAAVAMPDPGLGERVCVYAVLKPGATLALQQLVDRMREAGVAAYKLPERLELVPELPLTKVGKVDKKQLRTDIALRIEAERHHSS